MHRAGTKVDLAIEGGTRVRNSPIAAWPWFSEAEVSAAAEVLRSGKVNYWTGEHGREFEREYAAATLTQHAVALMNGTVALELALLTFGIGPGDEVITSSRTFIASASCAAMRGATPIIADVDRESGNVTAESIQALITKRTKAIIVVHLAGWPCDMQPIIELAKQSKLKLIEDCAQAHGATYRGRPVGSFGDASAFSFCQDKIISTGGEGGMLVTNDEDAWKRAWAYKDHGKSYDAVFNREHPPGFRWLHETFGTNWRLTEVQSVIGRIMLGNLPEMVLTRQRNARVLGEAFERHRALRVVEPPKGTECSYYRYTVYVRPERLKGSWSRDRVMAAVNAEGIPCNVGGCSEIYLEKAFLPDMRPAGRLPIARELGETALSFLVHPTLTDKDLGDTCAAVEKVMSAASD
jgi:dTDP-4-amino-4,6-dideoxygalactose transaminase